MSLPSFSLQSTLALSDPRWGAQVLSYFCVFGWSWILCLGWRTWERSGLQEIGSEVSHV